MEKFVIYYGAEGHGKGWVYSMCGFGVKTPLRRAVITENFSYKNAKIFVTTYRLPPLQK